MIYSCNSNTVDETSRISIGKIIDVNILATSWNEMPKTQIKTEHASIVIGYTPMIRIGVEAFVITTDNNQKYITWVGCCDDNKCHIYSIQ